MKILLVSATEKEIQPTIDFLDQNAVQKNIQNYFYHGLEIRPFITGVGGVMAAYALARIDHFTADQSVIHAGISGTYSPEISIGSVVEIVRESWGDMGAENADKSLTDLFELGLADPNQKPFTHGYIEKKDKFFATNLKAYYGLTLNTSSGSIDTIEKIKKKYNAEIESMEGAAIFYSCRMRDIPFVSIRGISNYVEERNKLNWNIPLAIQSLNKYLIHLLNALSKDNI